MDLLPARVERIIQPTASDFAAVVRAESKAFQVFVGHAEAFALFRELKAIDMQRPLSHDLMVNVFTAFEIEVRQAVISSLVEGIYCSTLFLARRNVETGIRQEVRLDVRTSDAMIITRKANAPLFVSREVYDAVEDISPLLGDIETLGGADEP